jgi:hypothetical protein
MFQRLKAEDEAAAQQAYATDGWTDNSWVEQPAAAASGHWEAPKANFPAAAHATSDWTHTAEEEATAHEPTSTYDQPNVSHEVAIRELERVHEEKMSAAKRSQRLVQEELEALKRQGRRNEAERTTLEEVVKSLKSELTVELETNNTVRQTQAALQGEFEALQRQNKRLQMEKRTQLEEVTHGSQVDLRAAQDEKIHLSRMLDSAREELSECNLRTRQLQQAAQRQSTDVDRQMGELQRQGQGHLEQLKGKEAEVKELHRQLQLTMADAALSEKQLQEQRESQLQVR